MSQFAATFSQDLESALGISVNVTTGSQCSSHCVFLTVDNITHYHDAAGRDISEGYSLSVDSTGITIAGASPLGVWWGTRTVLQQASLNNGSIPFGSGTDTPGWGTRGMMLDVGRHFYPKDFLIEICAYMSYFKMNTFHLHLSDNLYNNPRYTKQEFRDLYARFRLYSDAKAVQGLNKYKNESYTRDEFDEIQTACAARGVTIIPELEAPGHAVVVVQWKPELGYQTDLSLLNISHPDAIPTMQAVWGTFLDWFHTRVISIGADEYRGPANDYNKFVNAMNTFIGQKSNKTIRIWGTFPPRPNVPLNVHQNVTIQHWEFFEDDPYFDYIRHNYSVVNSNDDFYIVNKYGGYPNVINMSKVFHGSPSRGPWSPNIFDMNNATRNPTAADPYVLGAIAPLWNDLGPNATVYSEAYYAWRKSLPALADKQWGGNLTEAEFDAIFETLQPSVPGQNLDRAIPSKTSTIFNYTMQGLSPSRPSVTVPDSSGNGYEAHTDCPVSKNGTLEVSSACSVVTPLSSKGRNYTLSMSVMLTALERDATLLSGKDSSLMLTPSVTLFASGNFFRLNSTFSLPLNTWADLTIVGAGNRTFATLSVASGSVVKSEFQTKMGINGDTFHWAEMAIEAPLKQVGGANCGWTGQLRSLSLTS